MDLECLAEGVTMRGVSDGVFGRSDSFDLLAARLTGDVIGRSGLVGHHRPVGASVKNEADRTLFRALTCRYSTALLDILDRLLTLVDV